MGNHYTGVVIADVKPNELFEIIDMFVLYDTSKDSSGLLSDLNEKIDPFIRHTHFKVVVLFEKIMFNNHDLIRRQKKIAEHYKQLGMGCRYLYPSQKSSGGVGHSTNLSSGDNRMKKKNAQESATHLLTEIGIDALLSTFNSFSRNHDVADALLATHYLYLNEAVFERFTR